MQNRKLKSAALLLLRYFQLSRNEFIFVCFLAAAALVGYVIGLFKPAGSLNPQPDPIRDRAFAQITSMRDSTGPDAARRKDSLAGIVLGDTARVGQINARASELRAKLGSNGPRGSSKAKPTAKIDLNRASLKELMTLPRVGPSTGRKIIAYRERHNGFKTIDEIKKIKGIGKKTFEKMKRFIIVVN